MTDIQQEVYLKEIVATLGSGITTQKQILRNYYIIDSRTEKIVKVRLLDMDGKPLGLVDEVEIEDFNEHYKLEPDFYNSLKSHDEIKLERILTNAEDHLENKEYLSAEFEFGQALKLDEENVRANFGAAKTYLSMGETQKATEAFGKLTHIEALFEDRNKHIFNELGIELRKLGLYSQAISFYKKAISISKDDENLFFNLGRAFFDNGDLIKAAKSLKKAIQLNNSLTHAKYLLKEVAEKIKVQPSL